MTYRRRAQTKAEHKTFKVKSVAVEVTIISSNYHIELNPSEVGSRDRAIIQEVVKEVAQTRTIDPTHQKTFKGTHPRAHTAVLLAGFSSRCQSWSMSHSPPNARRTRR